MAQEQMTGNCSKKRPLTVQIRIGLLLIQQNRTTHSTDFPGCECYNLKSLLCFIQIMKQQQQQQKTQISYIISPSFW